jgi:hypothetical protein
MPHGCLSVCLLRSICRMSLPRQSLTHTGCVCAVCSVQQTSPSVPPLDLDVELPASADLGQLSADLSQRIARVEKNVDAKMDQVLAALQEVTRKVDKLAGDGDGPSSPATRMLSSDSAV